MELEDSVLAISGVGEYKGKRLNTLGIRTVRNLVEHFPRDYEDRSELKKIAELIPNEVNSFRAEIISTPDNIRIKNKILTRVMVKDETGTMLIVWYQQSYLKNVLVKGAEYLFTGKLSVRYGKMEVESPEYEKVTGKEMLSAGRIIPLYPATNGLSQKILRGLIKETIEQTKNKWYEFLPEAVRKKYQLAERNFAIYNIHFPINRESFFLARKRLVFEELFLLQTALFQMKASLLQEEKGKAFAQQQTLDAFFQTLPFSFTQGQKKVFLEMENDLKSGKRMNRLVQGDVGSGKTAVAMLACYWAIQNGYQAALMAPTEVLANQHFQSFQEIFGKLGIHTVLLTGAMKKKEKQAAYDSIAAGTAQMVIGTHAVIQETVSFYNLGLVITDEQHRFGVRQRGDLSLKGQNPHVLVMTATPIPRTLALILYGDLDISTIDGLPPGRQEIDTLAVTPSYHQRIYTFIRKEVDAGRQAYIICPMIEENEKLDVQAVLSYTAELQEKHFSGYQVTYLHGKMKATEKQQVMEAFAAGVIQILVSTTVIEVGINVPNATIMLIENAERFGLSQLHQLRGRVGRGSEKSYCILVCDSKNAVAVKRMKIMKTHRDGFAISEMDLQLRGPGEFFGTRQHGLPEMKIANLYTDLPILKEAQEAARDILLADPKLHRDENARLKEELEKFFADGQVDL